MSYKPVIAAVIKSNFLMEHVYGRTYLLVRFQYYCCVK